MRDKYPKLFFSQFSNKLIYTQIGSLDIFKTKDCNLRLDDIFLLEIDGRPTPIDEFENLVLLNIDHWGGGVTDLWKAGGKFKKAAFGDGQLEVIGLTDVLHMAQVQVGMDEPFQVGQGGIIRLKSKQDNRIVSLQIDGEPLEIITPFEIVIERKDQVNVLATAPSEKGTIVSFLKQAAQEGLIDQKQLEGLVGLARRTLPQPISVQA